MNLSYYGVNVKKRPIAPPMPRPPKVLRRSKPQGPQNEVIKASKLDWYCFGLGWAVASLFFGTLSFLFGG